MRDEKKLSRKERLFRSTVMAIVLGLPLVAATVVVIYRRIVHLMHQ